MNSLIRPPTWSLTDVPGAKSLLSPSFPSTPSVPSVVLVHDKVSCVRTLLVVTNAHSACRIPSNDELRDRAESSLSHRCDPHNQPPASPEPESVEYVSAAESLLSMSPEEKGNHSNGEASLTRPALAAEELDARHRRPHRLRPLSWLPFSRSSSRTPYPRSTSIPLPKASSTSTVARSVISAPILTSTTNVSVARAEGVHCGEISDFAFSQSTWNSQVGWVAEPADQDGGKVSHDQHNEALTHDPPSAQRKEKQAFLSGRGRMLKLGDAIKSKIRSTPLRKQTTVQKVDRIVEEVDESNALLLDGGVLQRRAETLNLYKAKIKGLTGSGHIRRKSLNINKDSAEKRDPLLLGDDLIETAPVLEVEQSDNDSAFGSLTRSFASAVDKLDFHATLPRNMSFLRSKSSFFNNKKGEKDSSERNETRRQISPPQMLAQVGQPATNLSPASSSTVLPRGISTTSRPTEHLPAAPWPVGPSTPKAQDFRPAQGAPTIHQSTPSPVVFSDEKNSYVPSAPVVGYPRGVKPLRMHPPDTMAIPPSLPSRPLRANASSSDVPPSFPRGQNLLQSAESEEDNDTTSLEDAPIYSPSLGDLSQYARDTPPSTKRARPESRKAKFVEKTPTRTGPKDSDAVEGMRGFLKKSRSGVGLFTRSKPDKVSTATSHGGGLVASSTASPLSRRDANQKVVTDIEKAVKKSRSMHFGGLFKKESHPDPIAPIPPAPFQPATPSPLRNVTRARGDSASPSTSAQGSSSALQSSKI